MVFGLALLTGCSGNGLLAPDADHNGDTPALQTSRAAYAVTRNGQVLTADIDFSYVNRTGHTRYVARCHQPYPPQLEKWTGSEWVVAYSPVVLLCWQTPLSIAPSATYTGTLAIRAWLPGNNAAPDWKVDGVAGTYRLVWRLLRSDSPDGPAPEPEKYVSNSFALTQS